MARQPKAKPTTNINDPRYIRAISHPLRTRLLAMLEEDAASPVALAERIGEPLGTVAYHVKTLHQLGLVDLVGTRERRGATEHLYRARAHPRFSDEAWDQLGTVGKQRIITASLNRIHEYATRSAAAGGFDKADAHFTRTPMKLDEQGWSELAKLTKQWLGQADRIEKRAQKRLAKNPHTGIDIGLVILLFEALPFSVESETTESRATARRKGSQTTSRRARSADVRR